MSVIETRHKESTVTALRFLALPTELVRNLQSGAPDANGQVPERHMSDGDVVPCRHCLRSVAAGEPYLILAHRPFPAPQPYAEQGPIFLHAEPCERHSENAETPELFLARERMLVRGYGTNDRIVYGTGQVVPTKDLAAVSVELLARDDIAYLHLRSSADNCFHCRIERR